MNRTDLALAACQGLSDKELEQRGAASFLKMIERKRGYAAASRALHKTAAAQHQLITSLQMRIKILTTQVETLESFDKPVVYLSGAADMLAAVMGKGCK